MRSGTRPMPTATALTPVNGQPQDVGRDLRLAVLGEVAWPVLKPLVQGVRAE